MDVNSEKDNMLNLADKGQATLDYKGAQTYLLPEPAASSKSENKLQQKKGRAKRKQDSPELKRNEFDSDLEELEKEQHTLKVLEGILREREEMLSLHEQKVIALREEYETKLRHIEVSDCSDELVAHKDRKQTELERLDEEHAFMESLLLERKRELEKLKDEELRLQMEMSKHARDIIEHQKKFDNLHRAIGKLEIHHRQKQNEFDDLAFKVDARKKEHATISKETAAARKELESIKKVITYDMESEIKALAKRVDDRLRNGDFERAKKDYSRLRELYSQLSREEKKKVYDKVAKVTSAFA